jgi:hypothetical protein
LFSKAHCISLTHNVVEAQSRWIDPGAASFVVEKGSLSQSPTRTSARGGLLNEAPEIRFTRPAPVGRPDTEEEARTIAEGRGAGKLISGGLVSAEIAERCQRQT